MDFNRLMGLGKKVAAIGSGNPATIATSLAPPDSPLAKGIGIGTQIYTAGASGGLEGLKSAAMDQVSKGDNPISRALAMKNSLDTLRGAISKPTPAGVANGVNQLDAMTRKRKEIGVP